MKRHMSLYFWNINISEVGFPCVTAGCDVGAFMESLYDVACLRNIIYLRITNVKIKTYFFLTYSKQYTIYGYNIK